MKKASSGPGLLLRVGICFALLAAGIRAFPQEENSLVHKPAPVFVRDDLTGKKVDLAAYRGRVVLLNFWATWCGPCRAELPRFSRWQRQYGPRGLQVLAVSMDDDAVHPRAMVQRLQLAFPVVMGDARLGAEYGGVLGLPVTYLIGRNGTIAARFEGGANSRRMEQALKKLLSQK